MTKDELIKLVDSKTKSGELTLDDYYELGVAHRELPKSEKSWGWLADLTKWNGSGESYRNFILRRLKSEGLVESPVDLNNEDSLVQKRAALYKERQQVRDEWSTYNRMMREDARFDTLKNLIEDSIKQLKPLKCFSNCQVKYQCSDSSEAILMLSDWHLGQDCSNFYNEYNTQIAEERVAHVVDATINYCKKFGIKTLHVLNLGDLIEGKINITGRVEANETTLKQLMIATEIMANALNKLSANIANVTYRSVVDNHSSIDKNYKDRLPEENLNILTTWYLKARLVNSNIEFKDDNLDIGLGRFSLTNGMKVAFFHGHEDPKDKTLQNLLGATHEWTDVVCAGHLHNPAEHVYQDMRLFVNGSLCGTGPYALKHRLFTKPSQKLIIIDSGNFLNLDISAN